jgi:hypothetical protein
LDVKWTAVLAAVRPAAFVSRIPAQIARIRWER